MSITDARKELRAWLDDMAALKGWAATGNVETQAFDDAFAAARSKALAAAKAYADAATRGEANG